jgi:hypothetical protein
LPIGCGCFLRKKGKKGKERMERKEWKERKENRLWGDLRLNELILDEGVNPRPGEMPEGLLGVVVIEFKKSVVLQDLKGLPLRRTEMRSWGVEVGEERENEKKRREPHCGASDQHH